MTAYTPRILFLDAYDSFSNNITSLLATTLQADVHVLPIDASLAASADGHAAALHRLLRGYDAVVCGPGPGSPDRPADTGMMRHVWRPPPPSPQSPGLPPTPALGICLGFQSLVAAHGGRIRRLRSGGLHGMVRAVDTEGGSDADGLFAGVPSPFRATLYHSLGADVGQDAVAAAAWPAARWRPQGALQPLAWLADDDDNNDDDDDDNERILMAVRHRELPFWGLQYHPESVCTDASASRAVLANWFRAARQWNAAHGRVRAELPSDGGLLAARHATRPSLLSLQPPVAWEDAKTTDPGSRGVVCRTIRLPDGVQVPDLVEVLAPPRAGAAEPEHIVLDSSSAVAPADNDSDTDADSDAAEDRAIRGRFSIVALAVGAAPRVEHRPGDAFATIRRPAGGGGEQPSVQTVPLRAGQTIWQLLAAFHAARSLPPLPPPSATTGSASAASERPFVGGFMGYVSYEQGLHDIGVDTNVVTPDTAGDRPGLCFAWVAHSLVVDHVHRLVHVQHLYDERGRAAATSAVNDVVASLQQSALWTTTTTTKTTTRDDGKTDPTPPPPSVHVHMPDLAAYEAKVRACQEHIAAGDAYELCLTDEARVAVTVPATPTTPATTPATAPSATASSWHYYRTLRTRNPAPFASYVRLGGATLVSSSPERFLWFGRGGGGTPADDGSDDDGARRRLLCSMRPMKGTVRRSAAVATRAQAAALLRVPKEEAENLMIVDLVRHDLHGVCGPGAVAVPRLLQVEPYGRVFQMVSVVEGTLTSSRSSSTPSGLDVLAASLPPGSMTGAPKKRSCALLCAIEAAAAAPDTPPRTRSLYAGVVGYWCATGQGDWSVTIRSLFRWDDETTTTTTDGDSVQQRTETWHVGAGGAVTILSTPEGERDEMLTKLAGPLSVFEP